MHGRFETVKKKVLDEAFAMLAALPTEETS